MLVLFVCIYIEYIERWCGSWLRAALGDLW